MLLHRSLKPTIHAPFTDSNCWCTT